MNSDIIPIYNRATQFIKNAKTNESIDVRHVVIREYLLNMLTFLKPQIDNKTFMQLKFVLNSRIVFGMEYLLPQRISKFFLLLDKLCQLDRKLNELVLEWDRDVIYF